ncbi:MAG: protein-L-isoaspartate O-methyltransferase [Patescibacteria group bacterium]|nr:protein-L-isoaspartate O-methyltransferase [Patescibacteria group bacterium]
MKELIQKLIDQGYLKTKKVIQALIKIKRQDFLPAELVKQATGNYPLPIGDGQTNSQPLTVAFMLELLDLQSGHKILDIGSGSGWTSALIAEIVGEYGRVVAIERVKGLKEFGEKNVRKYFSDKQVKFICADGSRGYKKLAPYDRIHVAAAGNEIPIELFRQLKVGGKLVMPLKNLSSELILIEKLNQKEYTEKRYPGFVFVPLIIN